MKITWAGFRRWRRTRPFWGGLLLLLAGLELFASANQTIGDLEVHFGPEGFLSYLLPVLLVLSGVLTWVTPAQRLFYGILGLLTAVYSLIGLNFGGFVLGMLLGILGGALVLAWAPRRTPPPTAPAAAADASHDSDKPVASHLPYGAPQQSSPEIVPGLQPGVGDTQEIKTAKPVHRKAFVLVFVPLAVTAAVLLAGARVPASADEKCPEGLPSRSAGAAPPRARKLASPKVTHKTPAAKNPNAAPRTTSPTPSPPDSSDDAEEGDASPGTSAGSLADGLHDLVDGVTGIIEGPGPSSPASAGPSPSVSAAPVPSEPSAPPSTAPSTAPSAGQPSSSVQPPSSPPSAQPSPSAGTDGIPCLGPRVFKQAGADDVPMVAVKPAVLETDKLTLYDSTYDGVVDLRTATGTMAALKFSMNKAVNEPFKLSVAEAGAHTTLITSKKLVTDGTVRFYTPKMQGKLFGVIPVTFTPQQPPPLTLPVLWFTDVRIDLAFIRCDALNADPLDLSEKA
ncbi:DUF6114 domain-containing protein [Actinoplanes sp. TFC3]|uniref:DUF6114 domain-containing protein n=1 Tax=Actinoplanes sp. TFC3 TaxID=1710355 RepID=UPI00082F36C6|nr:DUF6114 domain-containing protein [Actinoplanes sp. TFC3]